VDAVCEYCRRGLNDFMVEIGGEVRARGRNRSGSLAPWIAKPLLGTAPSPAREWVITLDNRPSRFRRLQDYFEIDGQIYSHEMDPERRPAHTASPRLPLPPLSALTRTRWQRPDVLERKRIALIESWQTQRSPHRPRADGAPDQEDFGLILQ